MKGVSPFAHAEAIGLPELLARRDEAIGLRRQRFGIEQIGHDAQTLPLGGGDEDIFLAAVDENGDQNAVVDRSVRTELPHLDLHDIGQAECTERDWRYDETSGVSVSLYNTYSTDKR